MHFFKSLLSSFKHAFFSNEEVQKLKNKHPRTASFIKNRLDRTKFSGLPLTMFGIAFLYVLFLFAGAVEDFITSAAIVQVDERVNTLFFVFRNMTAVRVYMWITLLGESITIIVFALLITFLLLFWRKKWEIASLWLTIVGTAGFTFLAKNVFNRPRPATAVFLETSDAFPSGHAAMSVALYGFITYLILRKLRKYRYRSLVLLSGILIILAIGFSRIYLGVHYVSDVWTGYLTGLLWLIIGISVNEWKNFKKNDADGHKNHGKGEIRAVYAGLISATFIFYIVFGFLYNPKIILNYPTTVESTTTDTLTIFNDFKLPRFTETLAGNTQEPVSFIITAKDDATMINYFRNAGWFAADSVNLHNTWELAKYAITNNDYPTAPMTPSFWNKQVHKIGFEKSTESKTVRQRHHARFWRTDLLTADGSIIYVGTSSLDTGIKWFITHRISPDIDTERELLFTDLQKFGAIKSFSKEKSVDPVLGKNFSGDQFFTDGEAYFIELND
jgi:membrane-associated phospholipid phosphatase